MAIGGDAAAQLWNAASSGQLTMEPDAAREVAGAYLRFAAACDEWAEEAVALMSISGFGSLSSAQQLQDGFAKRRTGQSRYWNRWRRLRQGWHRATCKLRESLLRRTSSVRRH